MSESHLEQLLDLEHHITGGHAFALYRLPGETHYTYLVQTRGDEVVTFDSVNDLNGKQGFVMAPFANSDNFPVVLIQPDKVVQYPLSVSEQPIETDKIERREWADCNSKERDDKRLSEVVDTHYASLFDQFIKALRGDEFEKLVLSRSVGCARTDAFQLMDVFLRACRCYVHAYVYLCYTPRTGVWFGSTPEILLSGKGTRWRTVALAGTQSLDNGRLPTVWDEKNKKEQEVVASYIRRQLATLGITPIEQGPYPIYAGSLSHLKSDFEFVLEERARLGTLLALLHPTPAVCGFPKEEACRFILSHEGYHRSYYSGFVGWLTPEGQTDLYVNLRCMHIDEKTLTLYAGGGLLPSSQLADEWLETEKKLQTMKRMLKFD